MKMGGKVLMTAPDNDSTVYAGFLREHPHPYPLVYVRGGGRTKGDRG